MVAHGGECLPIKPTRGDTFAKPAVHLIDSTFEEVRLCCMNQPAEPASPNPIKGQATFTAIGAAI